MLKLSDAYDSSLMREKRDFAPPHSGPSPARAIHLYNRCGRLEIHGGPPRNASNWTAANHPSRRSGTEGHLAACASLFARRTSKHVRKGSSAFRREDLRISLCFYSTCP